MALNLGELFGTITMDNKAAMKAIGATRKGMDDTAASADKMQADIDAASQKVAKAKQREADAAGTVRVAEAKMVEARKKGNKDSSAYIAAQERLETANRKLAGAQDEAKRSVDQLAKAHDSVSTSMDEAETKLSGFGARGAALMLGAGVAIGAALSAGILKSMDVEKANDKGAAIARIRAVGDEREQNFEAGTVLQEPESGCDVCPLQIGYRVLGQPPE